MSLYPDPDYTCELLCDCLDSYRVLPVGPPVIQTSGQCTPYVNSTIHPAQITPGLPTHVHRRSDTSSPVWKTYTKVLRFITTFIETQE